MVDRRKGLEPGSWWMLLLALPFAAVGLGVLCLSVVPTLHDWTRMQSWRPVEAHLEAAALQHHRGSKGGSTQSVEARYRYSVGGREFHGERVAIADGADNVGDFQSELGAALEDALRQERAITVWVNPDDPAEAIIDRSLRPGLLALKLVFVVAFGGVGFGVLYALWRTRRARYRRDADAPARTAAAAAQRGFGAAAALDEGADDAAALARVLDREAIPGGVRLVCPYGRHRRAMLPLLVFGLVFATVGGVTGADGAPLVFPLVFGGIGAALALLALWAMANRLSSELDRQYGLRSERRLLGLVVARRRLAARDIRGLRARLAWTMRSGKREQAYYRLQVRGDDGRAITIADGIPGRATAERLLRELGTQTGFAVDTIER